MAKHTRLFSRSVITPITAASFAIISLTGVLMLLGVRSGPVKGFHELVSVVFVVSAALHLSVNWGAFLPHVRRPLTIALGAVVAVVVVLLGASFGTGGRPEGGRPPLEVVRRLETASLASVAPVLGVELQRAVEILRRTGARVADPGKTIADIAASSGKHPSEILALLVRASPAPQPAENN